MQVKFRFHLDCFLSYGSLWLKHPRRNVSNFQSPNIIRKCCQLLDFFQYMFYKDTWSQSLRIFRSKSFLAYMRSLYDPHIWMSEKENCCHYLPFMSFWHNLKKNFFWTFKFSSLHSSQVRYLYICAMVKSCYIGDKLIPPLIGILIMGI